MEPQASRIEALEEIDKHALSFAKKFHPVYVAFEWEWASILKGTMGVPILGELELMVRRLVKGLKNDVENNEAPVGGWYSSSGGIRIGWKRNGKLYHPILQLCSTKRYYDLTPEKISTDKKVKEERTTIEQDLMEALIK